MLKHIKKIFAWLAIGVGALGTVGAFIVKWDDIIDVVYKVCDVGSPPPCSPKAADTIKCAKDLFSNPNQAHLQVKVLPDPSFKEGENMQMRFLSEKEGQLLVFDINSEGALTLLMPNQYYNDGFKLEANKEFIMPENNWGFDFPAEEPFGNGMLVSILIEDEIDLKSILPVSFQALSAGMAKPILQHLNDQLTQSVMLDGVLRPYKWSGVISNYEINNQ